MAWDKWAALPQPWPSALGVLFCCCFLLDLVCLHRQYQTKGHLCVGCNKDIGDIIFASLLSVVWLEIRHWMISSPLRMSNLDIFPRSVCLPRMSSPLCTSLLTLKSGLESRSSPSGHYSELGAQNFGSARTVTMGLGDTVKHGMRTHFITCCASPSFLS